MAKLAATPLVSIIMPVYNAERYLAQAIESVLKQTWQNIELIIVIDGSKDQSATIAKTYQTKNIQVLEQENLGASAARNKGIRAAKGQYFQFLDADDILQEDKIRLQVEELENQENFIAFGKTVHFHDDDNHLLAEASHAWFLGTHDPVQFLTKLYGAEIIGENYGGMIQPNAWLVPKEVITKTGFWNEELTLDDDGEFFCRVILSSEGVKYVPKSINYYRKLTQAKTNLSAAKSKKAFESAILSTDLKYKHLLPHLEEGLLNKIFSRLYWDIAISLYPFHLGLFKKIKVKIRALGSLPPKNFYIHTKLYRFTTQYFGWKVSAWISFLKHSIIKYI
jgi:glycosyltransferase involved in cell wall biosynthesis